MQLNSATRFKDLYVAWDTREAAHSELAKLHEEGPL